MTLRSCSAVMMFHFEQFPALGVLDQALTRMALWQQAPCLPDTAGPSRGSPQAVKREWSFFAIINHRKIITTNVSTVCPHCMYMNQLSLPIPLRDGA